MAEEFQARICGENWWSSTTTIDSTRTVLFPLSSSSSSSSSISSPCSVAAVNNDAGNYNLKATKFCAETEETNNTYLGFVDDIAQKPHNKSELLSSSASASGSSSGGMLIDSTLQMMGFGLTSSTASENWNQPLLFRCNGRAAESNFHSVIHEETGIIDSSNSQIHRDWIPKISFSSGSSGNQLQIDDDDDDDDNNFKPLSQEFSLYHDHHSLSSLNRGCFPIGSASYIGNPSTLQSLYDPNPHHPQHYSLFTNRPMSYSSKACYGTPCTELPPTWSKVSTFLKPTTIAKQQQQHPNIGLHFSNNTPFWNNASAEAPHDIRVGTFASSSQSQSQYQRPRTTFDEEKHNSPSTLLNKRNSEEITLESVSMAKKNVCEPALKRPRIETPSPLPTFKVRKEKLGDRVTALQQLVSPFGKTDTASVLHEAIEYIKFLHDQVNVLSTSYMKNGVPIQQQQGYCDDLKESEAGPQVEDLKSKGLCLVPISSTFPVSTETTTTAAAELWTPTFRGTLFS